MKQRECGKGTVRKIDVEKWLGSFEKEQLDRKIKSPHKLQDVSFN